MSESELLELKNQIKQEILAEMNTKKENQNTWQKIKKEYEEDFKLFNYEYDNKVLGSDYKYYTQKAEKHFEYQVSNVIGILLRLLYKADNVSKINANYEEIKSVVEQILNVLRQNKKEIEV